MHVSRRLGRLFGIAVGLGALLLAFGCDEQAAAGAGDGAAAAAESDAAGGGAGAGDLTPPDTRTAGDGAGDGGGADGGAPDAAAPQPESDPPVWSEYAHLDASNVGPEQVWLTFEAHYDYHWGVFEPEDASGVEAYGLFIDHADTPAMTIDADDRRFFAPEGIRPDTTYHFQVQAVDVWGNWSTNGPDVTVKTECPTYWEDRCPPTWPENARIEVVSAHATSVVLEWTAAEDNHGVRAYRLERDGAVVDPQSGVPDYEYTTEGDVTTARVRDLAVGDTVRFEVLARDRVGFEHGGGWVAGPALAYTHEGDPDPPDPDCHTDCFGGVFCLGEPDGWPGLAVSVYAPVPCAVSESEGWTGIDEICMLGAPAQVPCEAGCVAADALCQQDVDRLAALLPADGPVARGRLAVGADDGLTLTAEADGAPVVSLLDVRACGGEPVADGSVLLVRALPAAGVTVAAAGDRPIAGARLTYGCVGRADDEYVYTTAALELTFEDGASASLAWRGVGTGTERWSSLLRNAGPQTVEWWSVGL